MDELQNFSPEDRYGLLDDAIQLYTFRKINFELVVKLIKSLVPEYQYINLKHLDEFISSRWNNLNIRASIADRLVDFVTVIYRPFWDKYGLSIEENNYDFKSAQLVAYTNLIEKCRDVEVALAIIDAKENDTLPSYLSKLYNLSKVKFSGRDEIYSLALGD